jgi:hypothetical protein
VILDKSVQQFPPSELVRIRYMQSLIPRWGGSYEQMDGFIERSRKEGMSRRVIAELSAVEEDDKGDTSATAGDERAPVAHFERALALAKEADPTCLSRGWHPANTLFATVRVLPQTVAEQQSLEMSHWPSRSRFGPEADIR